MNKKKGENPEKYRQRIKQLVSNQRVIDSYQIQFKHYLEDVLQKLKIHLNAIRARIEYLRQPGRTVPRAEPYSGIDGTRTALGSQSEKFVKEIISETRSKKQIKKVTVTKKAHHSLSATTMTEEKTLVPDDDCLILLPEIDLMDLLLSEIDGESPALGKLLKTDLKKKK